MPSGSVCNFPKIKSLLILTSVLALSSCAVVPKFSDKTDDCELFTREFTLDIATIDGLQCDNESCIALILGVGTVTAIVSGSIYLVGNTVHFLEKQGRCDDSATRATFVKFTDYYRSIGGEEIDSTELIANTQEGQSSSN